MLHPGEGAVVGQRVLLEQDPLRPNEVLPICPTALVHVEYVISLAV